MTSNGSVDLPSEEWGRVSTASSLVGLVSRYVIDLQQLSREQMPGWLVGQDLPAGWRSGRLEGRSGQPWRISVCGPQPDGGRDRSVRILRCCSFENAVGARRLHVGRPRGCRYRNSAVGVVSCRQDWCGSQHRLLCGCGPLDLGSAQLFRGENFGSRTWDSHSAIRVR
jgi:hypothetical protein